MGRVWIKSIKFPNNFTLGTIHMLRQHIFGLIGPIHPLSQHITIQYWTSEKNGRFLTPPTQSICLSNIRMVPYGASCLFSECFEWGTDNLYKSCILQQKWQAAPHMIQEWNSFWRIIRTFMSLNLHRTFMKH